MSAQRHVLHVDMDAFFAAVEVLRRPELQGKPLVIGGRGDPTQRGVVATASYEARKFGVHSAMPLRTAFKLCPDCVFLPVDYREYSRMSRVVKEILHRFSPVMQDMGIDEAYLDVTGSERPADEIAREIKQRVRDETGLTCSIGVAPNKRLAKIASDLHKPDGLTVIGDEDLETQIWPLGVRKVPGIGPKTEERLAAMGIRTIGELAAQPLDLLIERFGPAHGQFLYEAAHGIDDRPLITHWEPKQHSRERTFQQDIDDWQTIARALVRLSHDVAQGLQEDSYRGRTVGIKVRFADFETHTREKTLPEATNSEQTIRKAAFECLARLKLDRRVRLLGVRVGELEKIPA
ncbi:MAG TPA: DNA polymerase IV [Burkholderiales bacterium]|nr:DNA polymerase IV [Burkholderiales bacterium]